MASEPLNLESPVRYSAGASLQLVAVMIAALVAIFWLSPLSALYAYLWAYCCVVAVPLGALAVVMLQHMTGGAWGVVIRRPLEAAMRTMPIMALLFVPIAYFADHIYPWAHETLPGQKSLYLNLKWFWIRNAVYFTIWILLSLVFNFWSRRQDRGAPESYERRFRLLAGPGLVLYGLTITFASIDWVMSLEPEWFSSIYGVLFGCGQLLSALSFGIVVVLLLANRSPFRETLTAGHLRDLGNMLLAFVMVWAYMSVSQLILIWSANIREEVTHYQARITGGWAAVAVAIAGLQFALPFFFLLGRGAKRDPIALMRIAGLVLAMRIVDMYWLIAPTRPVSDEGTMHTLTVYLADPIVLVCVVGLWLLIYRMQLSRWPLLPVGVDASVAEDHHG